MNGAWLGVKVGVKGVFSSTWGIVGWIVTTVSSVNLVVALFTIPVADVVAALLEKYREIFHTVLGWLLYPLPFTFPGWVYDSIVVYGIFGGAIARRIMAHHPLPQANWSNLYKVVLGRSTVLKRRQFWRVTPWIPRLVLITVCWPFWLPLIFRAPYIDPESSEARFSAHFSGQYDDRMALLAIVLVIVLTVFLVIGVSTY